MENLRNCLVQMEESKVIISNEKGGVLLVIPVDLIISREIHSDNEVLNFVIGCIIGNAKAEQINTEIIGF